MATVTLVGCIAAAIVGITQVYKSVRGAVEAAKQIKQERERQDEV